MIKLEDFTKLNDEIELNERKQLEDSSKQWELEKQKRELESKLDYEIVTAKIPEDDTKLMYTNDKQRKAALKIALNESEAYKKIEIEIDLIKTCMSAMTITLEHRKRAISFMKAICYQERRGQ